MSGKAKEEMTKWTEEKESVLEQCESLEYYANQISSLVHNNKLLRKAILEFGKNPAGFDWAVLERIETMEEINKELLEACKLAVSRLGKTGHDVTCKTIQAVIARAEGKQ